MRLTEAPESSTEQLIPKDPEQRKAWLETGALPPEPEEPETAESQSPESVEVSETEQAESEPAKQEKVQKKKNAESRIHELLAENKRLKSELARKPEKTEKAESSTAKAEERTEPKTLRDRLMDITKDPAKYGLKTYEELVAAMIEEGYRNVEESVAKAVDARDKQLTKERLEANEAQVREAQEANWKDRLEVAREKHSDFDIVALQEALTKADGIIKTGSVMDQWILKSPDGAEVLYYLGTHLDDAKEIAKLDRDEAIERLTEIRLSLNAPVRRNRPPSPPREVAGTGTAPADPIQDAVKRGDMVAYKRLMDAQDRKRRTG